MKRVFIACVAILAGLLPVAWQDLADAAGRSDLKAAFKRPLSIPFGGETPYSPQLATLGKMMFFDPRLSGAKNLNCASCHNPSFGYETPVEKPVGAKDTELDRQAPTILNMAWVKPLFWDGRAATLEEQAAGPISASAEMNGKFEEITENLSDIAEYSRWFKTMFPERGITKETILTAIATYERTVVSGWSPFDRWVDGKEDAISESGKRGFELFVGKARCADCHSGWNFTDNRFHDIGLGSEDIGRAKIDPADPKAKHAFKTPGLRNTAYRGPFMHDGSIDTLEGVMAHYESGGIERPSRSDLMDSLDLSDQEREDLIAFMRTLTAEKQKITMPILPN